MTSEPYSRMSRSIVLDDHFSIRVLPRVVSILIRTRLVMVPSNIIGSLVVITLILRQIFTRKRIIFTKEELLIVLLMLLVRSS